MDDTFSKLRDRTESANARSRLGSNGAGGSVEMDSGSTMMHLLTDWMWLHDKSLDDCSK